MNVAFMACIIFGASIHRCDDLTREVKNVSHPNPGETSGIKKTTEGGLGGNDTAEQLRQAETFVTHPRCTTLLLLYFA